MKSFLQVHLLLILLLLGSFASAQSQKPQLSIHANLGTSHTWRHGDYYDVAYRKWHAQAGIGLGLGISLARRWQFSPELGLEYYGFAHDYDAPRDPRTVNSSLGLFYGRISPGLTWRPIERFSIRAGFSMMGSVLTVGTYAITTYVNGDFPKVTYTDHFSRIRNPFIMGPEMTFGWDAPSFQNAFLGVRMTGFIGMNSVFKPDFSTPFNPMVYRLNLGMAYTFSNTSRKYEAK